MHGLAVLRLTSNLACPDLESPARASRDRDPREGEAGPVVRPAL